MRSPIKILTGVCLGLLLSGPQACLCLRAQSSRDTAESLQELASGAQEKRGWPALRRFAQGARDGELRGEAYFALGYREYEAGEYQPAATDLEQVGKVSFSLADYAEYYRGEAELYGKHSQLAVDVLDGFVFRHPQSVLRFDALALFAEASIQSGEPDRAIQALTAEPRTRQRPPLELFLARAYQRAGHLEEGARSFQDVYYNFPTSPEAEAAGEALVTLRTQSGTAKFPSVSEELETARAQTLFDHARIPQALKEFSALLQSSPASPFAPCWKVGRARCLLRLKRTAQALDELQTAFPSNPVADAERMALLVEVYAPRDDNAAMDSILAQLRGAYPHSPSYASALDAAGNHLVRQGDWQGAARYYEPLGALFPETQLGEEANWRIAWSNYLQKENAKARQAFVDHATRYPSSPHVVADFYWLGRLAEEGGAPSEARAFYDLVQKRWAQSYYADASRKRRAGLNAGRAAPGGADAQSGSLANELAQKVLPPAPPLDLCVPPQRLPALRPYSILLSLHLDDLAEKYLKAILRERPASPALFIALSRFEAQKGTYNPSVLDAGKVVPFYYDYEFSALPAEIWNLLYPTADWTLVEREARARGLDPYLVMGLIRQESAFDPQALSPANARGLMQILPGTARSRKSGRGATARRLYDPAYNVRVGTDYLQHLLELNHGVFEQAMAAYHAGEERVSTWLGQHTLSDPAEFLETIPIPATRIYVEKVVRDAAIYRRLMTGTPMFKKCG